MQNELHALFHYAPQPTLEIQEDHIMYSNPAADAFFGASLVGWPARSVLPEELFRADTAPFKATLMVKERPCVVTASRLGESLILSLSPEREASTESFVTDEWRIEMLSALTNVDIAIDRLSSSLEPDAAASERKYLTILRHNYYAMRRMLEHLDLAVLLSRRQAPFHPQRYDLVRLCRELVESLAPLLRDRAELRFSTELTDLELTIDPGRIEQLLLNLLTNSFAAVRENGLIQVEVSLRGESAVLTVRDNGSGIRPEIYHNLFSRYDRSPSFDPASPLGSGLGLSLVQGIAELHGGSVVMESQEGKGTSVYVSLPCDNAVLSVFDSATGDFTPTMDRLLTELSGLLDSHFYQEPYTD